MNTIINNPNHWKVISIHQTQHINILCGFEINLPKINTEINSGELEINGWVLGRINPVKNIIVSFKSELEEKVIKTDSLSIVREDIADVFVQIENAAHSGFSTKINLDPNFFPFVTTFMISAELENQQCFLLSEIVLEYDQKVVEAFLLQQSRKHQKITGKIISVINQYNANNFHGFHLDLLSEQDNVFDNCLEIQGWVLSKILKIAEILVTTDDSCNKRAILGRATPNLIREDVGIAFPEVENATQSGFFIKVNVEELFPISFLEIKARSEDNSEYILTTIKIQNHLRYVCEVSKIQEPFAPELLSYHIDIPQILESPLIYEFYDLEISGWVLGKDSRVTHIELLDNNNYILQIIPIQYERLDVFELFQDVINSKMSGFSTIINLLILPIETTISLIAKLESGTTALLSQFSIQRFPLHTLYQPRLQPLIINSLGRSGTTWLMHLLAQHLKIATYKNYPYELPVIEHFLHNMLIRNTFESYPDQIPYPDLDVNDLFKLNRHRMYYVKEETLKYLFRKQQVDELACFCQEQIDKYIEQILSFQQQRGEGLENPIYFAEKLINPSRETEYLSRLLWELYPQGKEIILVRDFRDMFCSIFSFMKKRNLKICFGLDFQHAHTDEEYVKITKERIDFIWDCWETRKHKAYLVRYEDLIEKPVPILKGIFKYLNLDHDEAILQMILQQSSRKNNEMTEHITSSTVDASLGRWKKDLSPELQLLCNEAFKPALEAFGYTI
jgi:hypothetical protein